MLSIHEDLLKRLDAREKRLPNYAYKLVEGGGQYGLDVVFSESLDLDESQMSAWIPFVDGNRRDGVGDLLEVGGIDLSRHSRNPIVLFDHGKEISLPIAQARQRDDEGKYTGAYTVELDPAISRTGRLNAFFYQGKGMEGVARGEKEYEHALFCEQLFDMYAKRLINGGSIGYQIQEARPIPADYRSGTQEGMHLLKVLMLEGSLVIMPANMDTVQKSWHPLREFLCVGKSCGKSLSPYLVKSLSAVLPAQKSVRVPLATLPNKKIPPARWKPGEGAEKELRGRYKSSSNTIIDAINELDPGQRYGIVSFQNLGQKLGMGPSALHNALRQLRSQGKVSLTEHEGGPKGRLTSEQQQWIMDPTGERLGFVSLKHLQKSGLDQIEEIRQVMRSGKFTLEPVIGYGGTSRTAALRRNGLLVREISIDWYRILFREGIVNEQGKWTGKNLSLNNMNKRLGDIPDYRKAESTSQSCKTCVYFQKLDSNSGHCEMYDAQVGEFMICDKWTDKRGTKGLRVRYGKSLDYRTVIELLDEKSPNILIDYLQDSGLFIDKAKRAALLLHQAGIKRDAGDERRIENILNSIKSPTKAQPRAENVIGFQVGDKVFARSWIMDQQNTREPFAKTGEPLKVVGFEEGSGRVEVQNRAGKRQYVAGGTEVRKGKSMQLRTGKEEVKMYQRHYRVGQYTVEKAERHEDGPVYRILDMKSGKVVATADTEREIDRKLDSLDVDTDYRGMKDLRSKYKTVKGIRRTLKKSSPGAAVLHVSSKDLDKVKELSSQRGLRVKWMGTHSSGLEKVKLMGDDEGIDHVAKAFGKRVKSLETPDMKRRIKAMPGDVPGYEEEQEKPGHEGTEQNLTGGEKSETPEKYSSQVLRRLHQDHGALLHEYDEMRGPLEHDEVDKHLQGELEHHAKAMDEVEALHAKHHPDEEPLEGAEHKGMDEGAEEEEEEDSDAVPADSGSEEEEEEPSPDEAFQGSQKRLRKEYKNKRLSVKKKKDLESDPEDVPGYEENQEEPGTEGSESDLQPHEKAMVKEAHGYLKELSETRDFGDEHRMKSYHYHKSLDPMGMVGDVAGSMGGGDEQKGMEDPQDVPGYEENQDKPGHMGGEEDIKSMCPHRKAIGEASHYFKGLSQERAFGDRHRQEALHHIKGLDPVAQEDEAAEVTEPDANSDIEPGAMGEKGIKKKKFPPVDKEDEEVNVSEPGEKAMKSLKETFQRQDKTLSNLKNLLSRVT